MGHYQIKISREFCKEKSDWLDDYSFFMAAKEFHGGGLWTNWDENLVKRNEKALTEWNKKLVEGINYNKFVQYIFFEQWSAVKLYANCQRSKNNWRYAYFYCI